MEFQKNTLIAAVSACAIAGLVGVAAWGLAMSGAEESPVSEVDIATSSAISSSKTAVSTSLPKTDSSHSSKDKKTQAASSSFSDTLQKDTATKETVKEEKIEDPAEKETVQQVTEQSQSVEMTPTENKGNSEKSGNMGTESKASSKEKKQKSSQQSSQQSSSQTKKQTKSESKSNSKDETPAAAASEPTPKPEKKWVDAVYKTVEHPEEGHYESVVVGTKYFCLCGKQVDSPDGWAQHRADFIASNGGKCNGQHVSYSEENITEEQWVVDSPAWSEQVLVSEGHWE